MEINSIYDIFKESASKYPGKTWLSFDRNGFKSITYSEANKKINQLTSYLLKQNLVKGDKIAIVSENSEGWCLIYMAIVANGFTAVPLDPSLKDEAIYDLILNSDSKLVFVSRKRNLGNLKVVEIEDKLFDEIETIPLAKINQEDIASIVYTSGTTSDPKGVMLSHKNFISDVVNGQKVFGCRSEDSLLLLLPLYHVFSFTAIYLLGTLNGSKLVLVQSFNKNEIFKGIKEGNVSIVFGVPRLFDLIYRGIIDKINSQSGSKKAIVNFLRSASNISSKYLKKNLGKVLFGEIHNKIGNSIRLMVSGGAPLSEEVFNGMKAFGFTIIEGYGLTETSPVIAINSPLNPIGGSVGKPIPGIEVKINGMNEDLVENGHKIGEVIVRGDIIMKGYYKREDLTNKMIKDGWLYTGDLGYFDKNGNLFLKGRSDNVIIMSSGKNVYPDEIEHHYIRSELINDICVLGIEEEGSQKVYGLIVPNLEKVKIIANGSDVETVIKNEVSKMSEGLPSYKKISNFKIFKEGELPKTSTLKFKKNLIKREIEEGKMVSKFGEEINKKSVDKVNDLKVEDRVGVDSINDSLFIILKEISGKSNISMDQDLEMDLSIDSIGVAECFSRLEDLGYKLNLGGSIKIQKVKDILNYVIVDNKESVKQIKQVNMGMDKEIPLRADFSEEGMVVRRDWLKSRLGVDIKHLYGAKVDVNTLKGNIEHQVGMTQVPTGIAGPLLVNGDHAKGVFYIPLATTEGALVASVNRGIKMLTLSKGVNVKVLGEQMIKAPMFVFDNSKEAVKFKEWVGNNFGKIKSVAESTTRFGKLEKIEEFLLGRRIMLRLCFSCGDAMGANMITMSTQKIVEFINSEYPGIKESFLQSNLEGEKKVNALNYISGRGRKVVADATIPRNIIQNFLHTTPEKIVNLYKASLYGSMASGMMGSNAHISNILTAVFLATGQDVAHVHDGSVGITSIDLLDNGDLYISVNLNSLPIGTIGGGTNIGTQKECLEIMGCSGTGKVNKLAEIISGAVLAGELSLAGSQAAGDFASMHDKFGRNRPKQ